VLTLVDTVNGMQQLDAQPEAVKQAAVADRLVLTKTDIAPASQALLSRLTYINPGAPCLTANRGDISVRHLFGANLGAYAGAAEMSRWLPEAAVAHAESQYKRVHAHDDHIRAYSVHLNEPVSTSGMTAWLTALASLRGANLLRVKGLLNVDGEPVAVHAVQTLIHEPVTLARWPDADRRSRLVFITRDLTREQIESTLDVLRLRTTNTAAIPQPLDPQAYARFVAAMKKIH
jgi:G3E family GTPase